MSSKYFNWTDKSNNPCLIDVTQQVGMSDDSSWSLDVTKTYHPSRMKFSNKILGGDQSLSMNTTDAITKAESI